MLHFLRLAAIANAACLFMSGATESRPNVLVISGDFGGERKAALLEQLNHRDFQVSHCFASPVASATLASWLTGSHEFRAGVSHVHGGRNFIRPDVPLVSDAFRSAGYRTAFVGDWGLGNARPFRPEDRGFQDIWISRQGGPADHWGPEPWLRTKNGWLAGEPVPEALHHAAATWLVDRAADKAPFFLQVNLPPGAESLVLLDDLARVGLEHHLVVVVLGTVGRISADEPDPVATLAILSDIPQKAGDVDLPPIRKGGSEIPRLIAAYDGMPTLASLCEVPLFRGWSGDGVDFPLLRKSEVKRSFFFHPSGWSAEHPADHYKSDGFVVRTPHWRLSGLELLDLDQPVADRHDVFDEHADIANGLLVDYGNWWQSIRPAITEPARIIVGDERDKVVDVTWGDWWPSRESPTAQGPDAFPDRAALKGLLARLADPVQAAAVPTVSGVWKLHANRPGNYRVTLSKLPPEATKEERDGLGKLKAGTVHVRSGKYEVKTQLLEGATSISLGIDLNEGPVDVEAWFENQNGEKRILGAFFATFERTGERKMPDSDVKVKPR